MLLKKRTLLRHRGLTQEPKKSSNLSITKMPDFFTLIAYLMSKIFVTKFKAVRGCPRLCISLIDQLLIKITCNQSPDH